MYFIAFTSRKSVSRISSDISLHFLKVFKFYIMLSELYGII